MALDGLAYIAALAGGEAHFDALCARVDSEDWAAASAVVSSQILYFRGLANLALGRIRRGKECLKKALASAENHGFGKLVFDAENALAAAERPAPTAGASQESGTVLPRPASEEVLGVCRELKEMREALVGAGSSP
jgi:hypothetical protein